MANRVFSASNAGQRLLNVAGAGGRTLTLGTMGESHGEFGHFGQVLYYALYRHYNADIYYDTRKYANGGTDFAIGGTTTNGVNGLLTQMTWMQARPCDIILIASGYNDLSSASQAISTVAANVITTANAAFAAGSKYVIIMAAMPRNADAGAWQSYNTYMRRWCAVTPGAFFVDCFSALADHGANTPLFATAQATGGSATYKSYTDDGTHISGYGASVVAPLLADVFRKIAPLRRPRPMNAMGADVDAVGTPYCNLLGDAGMMMGTKGLLNGSFNTGVAGTANDNSRILITTAGTGLTVTPSIDTSNADGYRRQRLTISGTPTGNPSITIAFSNWSASAGNGGNAARTIQMEAGIKLTGVTGLADITLRPESYATYFPLVGNNSSNNDSTGFLTTGTEDLFLYSTCDLPPPTSSGFAYNNAFSIVIFLRNSVALAGTIDISRAGVFLTSLA